MNVADIIEDCDCCGRPGPHDRRAAVGPRLLLPCLPSLSERTTTNTTNNNNNRL